MCVDLPGAVSQVPVPPEQSDHIACGRDVSGFVIVSVALAHPNGHPVPALVVQRRSDLSVFSRESDFSQTH